MKYSVAVLTVFIFSGIFARHRHKNESQRSVNLAWETSLLFEPKDLRTNLGLVSNIRSFLDKIYDALLPPGQFESQGIQRSTSLGSYLYNFGSNLLGYGGEGIQLFTNVLRQAVNGHTATARSSYHEIFSDPALKKILQENIDYFSNMDGVTLQKKLHEFINSHNPVLRSFTQKLNKYYSKEDLDKLHKFMKKFDKYIRKKKDTSKLIKQWLNFGIFDRYNKLNYSTKVRLLDDMRWLKDYLDSSSQFRAKDETVLFKLTTEKVEMKKAKYEDVSGSDGEEVHKHHRHSHAKETGKDINKKNAFENKEKRSGRKTEVIVDNVEVFLQTVKE